MRIINFKKRNVELLKAIYHARLNEERADTACDNLHNLSAFGWNEYEDFEGINSKNNLRSNLI